MARRTLRPVFRNPPVVVTVDTALKKIEAVVAKHPTVQN